MKILQESTEEKWGSLRTPQHPRSVILLLHGFRERGKRIFRKLIPYLPEDALVLAPNGSYPLSSDPDTFAWYTFDRGESVYAETQSHSRSRLVDLLAQYNPKQLPVTIIGFSQGGIFAPTLGNFIPHTKCVLGIACEFRAWLVPDEPKFNLIGIHGSLDSIITTATAELAKDELLRRGIKCEWHLVKEAGHEITREMGAIVKSTLETYGK